MSDLPPIHSHDTCSSYWNRLTPAEKEAIRTRHLRSTTASMTVWLLERGCRREHMPPNPKWKDRIPVIERQSYNFQGHNRQVFRRLGHAAQR